MHAGTAPGFTPYLHGECIPAVERVSWSVACIRGGATLSVPVTDAYVSYACVVMQPVVLLNLTVVLDSHQPGSISPKSE